ncbi:MAG: D-alanyl-D-alanine carboxypeptidase family protein [Ruminococcus sp.]|nr:D-alanyl-D-alanine carboxypeptidase family protein [Ruminococcus sp.]
MNKGERRRQRRRYRVRYDRIVIFALILAAIAVLATSCVLALTGKGEKPEKRTPKPETTTSAQTTAPAGEDTTKGSGSEVTTKAVSEKPTQAVDDGYTAETHTHDEIFMGDLVLVNAEHEYKFIAGDLDLLTVVSSHNDYYTHGDYVTKLDREVISQLNAMMAEFARASSLSTTNIFVQDGYRTFEEQVDRHNSGKSSTFEAGHCDYHTGRTFDMFRMNDDGTTPYFRAEGDCAWFADNACRFGFIVRYPEGKDEATGEKARTYTYRYVGAPHAAYMHENGLCLEEYIAELKAHTKEDPLISAVDGAVSLIYYVPASEEGDTDVPVPKDREYTVSGNNSDGFIVTAKK